MPTVYDRLSMHRIPIIAANRYFPFRITKRKKDFESEAGFNIVIFETRRIFF